jgi:hypothetical protein
MEGCILTMLQNNSVNAFHKLIGYSAKKEKQMGYSQSRESNSVD